MEFDFKGDEPMGQVASNVILQYHIHDVLAEKNMSMVVHQWNEQVDLAWSVVSRFKETQPSSFFLQKLEMLACRL